LKTAFIIFLYTPKVPSRGQSKRCKNHEALKGAIEEAKKVKEYGYGMMLLSLFY
jgi:hypothetical protein